MERRLGLLGSISLAVTVMLGISAVSSTSQAADIRFTVAEYSSKTGPFFEKVAKDYEALHPDTHIRITVVPWDNILQQLTTDLAANTPPDMAIVGTRWLYDFASQGVVEPLDGYLSADFKKSFIQTLMAPSIIDGKVMGIPVGASARAMLVNMDLLSKAGVQPPKTWVELHDMAKKVSAIHGNFGFGLQGKQIETDSYFYYILWSFGGDIFTKDGKSGLDSPAGIAAATFYKKMLDEKLTQPEPTNYSREDIFNMFKQGKLGAVFTFPMLIPQIKAEAPNLHYAVLPFPVENQKASLGVTDSLVIFAGSKEKKTAADFMQFTYQEKYRRQFDENEGLLPVTVAVANEDYFKKNPDMAAFTAGLDYVKFIPAVPNWEQMADVTTRALQQIYLGQASPADAMKAAATQVNAIRAQP
jgi:multiple sugar transport system substrate-binding protein